MTGPTEPTIPEPGELTELHGTEGGRWKVQTQNSVHLFDLDAQTVTRLPGPHSRPGINDVTRPIRTIEACAVGRSGYWTMLADREHVEFYWQLSTKIACISRMPDESANDDE